MGWWFWVWWVLLLGLGVLGFEEIGGCWSFCFPSERLDGCLFRTCLPACLPPDLCYLFCLFLCLRSYLPRYLDTLND